MVTAAGADVHDVGDAVADHGDVVDREVAVAAQAEQAAQVGGAQADRQHVVGVFVHQPAHGAKRLDPGLPVDHRWAFQHRHRPQRPADRVGGSQHRLERHLAALLGELRQDEPGQAGRPGRPEPPDQVGDLAHGTDPDEQQRHAGAGARRIVGEVEQRRDDVRLGGGDLGVGDRVLQAQHHGRHPGGGLAPHVVGQLEPGAGRVEGGAERRGEQPAVAVGGDLLRRPIEQSLDHRGVEEGEVAHAAISSSPAATSPDPRPDLRPDCRPRGTRCPIPGPRPENDKIVKRRVWGDATRPGRPSDRP